MLVSLIESICLSNFLCRGGGGGRGAKELDANHASKESVTMKPNLRNFKFSDRGCFFSPF